MVPVPFMLPEAQGKFSLIIVVGPAWAPGGKSHSIVGGPPMNGSRWKFNLELSTLSL